MATLTIELDEKHLEELRTEAARMGISVESYAQTMLLRALGYAESRRDTVDQETIERAMKQTLEKNAKLYRRLAQS